MQIIEFLLSPIFRAILIVLLLPLLLLSAFRYSAYALFIFFLYLLVISWMLARIKKMNINGIELNLTVEQVFNWLKMKR